MLTLFGGEKIAILEVDSLRWRPLKICKFANSSRTRPTCRPRGIIDIICKEDNSTDLDDVIHLVPLVRLLKRLGAILYVVIKLTAAKKIDKYVTCYSTLASSFNLWPLKTLDRLILMLFHFSSTWADEFLVSLTISWRRLFFSHAFLLCTSNVSTHLFSQSA